MVLFATEHIAKSEKKISCETSSFIALHLLLILYLYILCIQTEKVNKENLMQLRWLFLFHVHGVTVLPDRRAGTLIVWRLNLEVPVWKF
jgi:hypothetical protein